MPLFGLLPALLATPRPLRRNGGHHREPVRLGLDFPFAPDHFRGEACWAFVRPLHRHRKRPLLVIWDRLSGHTKAARLLQELSDTRREVAFLPASAPELNVVDHCWGHTKYGALANWGPAARDEIAEAVAQSLLAKHRRHDLLRGAGLAL